MKREGNEELTEGNSRNEIIFRIARERINEAIYDKNMEHSTTKQNSHIVVVVVRELVQ